jgi:hypothetical protein
MKRFTLPTLLFALAVVLMGAGYGVKLNAFGIQEDARDFVITWQADKEEGVYAYEIRRRTPFSRDNFLKVEEVKAHGVNKPYLFRDTQAYKSASDQVEYRLEVVYSNGLREVLASKSLNYTSTPLRRSWGSIKAMFQ